VKSLACGICGTAYTPRKHAETMIEVSRRTGGAFDMDLSRDLIFGHEFCAELADYGPGTEKRIKPGRRVRSMRSYCGPAARRRSACRRNIRALMGNTCG
jgi:threonine dehydrogenase-like Zn-dependent dehydrogenase